MVIILITLMQSVFEFVNYSLRSHLKAAYLSIKHKSTLGSLQEDFTKSNYNIEDDASIWQRYLLCQCDVVRMESWV